MSMTDSLCYGTVLTRPKAIIKRLNRIKHLSIQRPIGHLGRPPLY